MAKIAQEWLEEYEKKFKAFKGPLHSSQHNLIKYALALSAATYLVLDTTGHIQKSCGVHDCN